MVGLLVGGAFEGPAVRLVTRSGTATEGELRVLWTVPELEHLRVLVCRRPAGTASPVVVMGRFTVVSAVLVEALQRGWVSAQEVPWRLVVGVFRSVGRAFAWMPLGYLAWRMRGVVALVCVAQSVAEGRPWSGVLGAGVIALTYLVPAGDRSVEARATAAGDAEVVAADLGGVLVEVLERGGQRLSLGRRQRLRASPSSGPSPLTRQVPAVPARHLHLVRG